MPSGELQSRRATVDSRTLKSQSDWRFTDVESWILESWSNCRFANFKIAARLKVRSCQSRTSKSRGDQRFARFSMSVASRTGLVERRRVTLNLRFRYRDCILIYRIFPILVVPTV